MIDLDSIFNDDGPATTLADPADGTPGSSGCPVGYAARANGLEPGPKRPERTGPALDGERRLFYEERAAIQEYDGGLDRADAERLALADVGGDADGSDFAAWTERCVKAELDDVDRLAVAVACACREDHPARARELRQEADRIDKRPETKPLTSTVQ